MSRVQTRVSSRALEAAGIQRADQGPRVSDNIQMGYSMGDLGFLLAPIPGADGFLSMAQGPVAAVFSGLELHATPDAGIQIVHIQNNSTITIGIFISVGGDRELDANITEQPADFATPVGSSRALIRQGTRTTTGGNLLNMLTLETLPQSVMPIKIFPGQHLIALGTTANTPFLMNLIWREVPIPANVV